jgi:hypothetical protein
MYMIRPFKALPSVSVPLDYGLMNDRIRSDEIEDFLDSKKAAARRRINLRSEIITLFRYAQIRLRALPRDRKTEAELVLRDQTKRKPVETFGPEEFQTFLGVVRPEWLPWLALGGLAGIRTDGEIFRITWECFKWDRRIIDLSADQVSISHARPPIAAMTWLLPSVSGLDSAPPRRSIHQDRDDCSNDPTTVIRHRTDRDSIFLLMQSPTVTTRSMNYREEKVQVSQRLSSLTKF